MAAVILPSFEPEQRRRVLVKMLRALAQMPDHDRLRYMRTMQGGPLDVSRAMANNILEIVSFRLQEHGSAALAGLRRWRHPPSTAPPAFRCDGYC